MPKPNILYLMTDQHLARALSCMGHDVVQTPHLDRLAARGTLFEQAYCPSPVCGPSRAALFSGLYPGANGREGNHDGFSAPVTILPDALRQAGYHTAMAGKLHLSPIEDDWGFVVKHLHDAGYDLYEPKEPASSAYVKWLADRRACSVADVVQLFNADETCMMEDPYRFVMGGDWRSADEHDNTWVTDRAIDCLRGAPADSPFFLFVSWFGPHQPMLPPEPWASMYDPDSIPLPPEMALSTSDRPIAEGKRQATPLTQLTEAQHRQILAAYYGQITMIDHEIGRLLDVLAETGQTDETIVVFTADHGDHAGQFGLYFKSTMYENAVRVPLIVADPRQRGGQRCQQIVNNLDTYATLLAAAGIPLPEPCHARSLATLMRDPGAPSWPDQTYAELGPNRMVAANGWKLFRKGDAVELYQLGTAIPDEANHAADPACQARLASLERLLADYQDLVAQGRTACV